MAFSYRDGLRQRPDFATMGTEIPESLRRARPAWTNDPAVVPSPNPKNPFGDLPRAPHNVDPPERNPYNDPDYSPFILTEYPSGQAGDEPVGGLPGMLRRYLLQQSQQQGVGFGSVPNGTPDYSPERSFSPQGAACAADGTECVSADCGK